MEMENSMTDDPKHVFYAFLPLRGMRVIHPSTQLLSKITIDLTLIRTEGVNFIISRV